MCIAVSTRFNSRSFRVKTASNIKLIQNSARQFVIKVKTKSKNKSHFLINLLEVFLLRRSTLISTFLVEFLLMSTYQAKTYRRLPWSVKFKICPQQPPKKNRRIRIKNRVMKAKDSIFVNTIELTSDEKSDNFRLRKQYSSKFTSKRPSNLTNLSTGSTNQKLIIPKSIPGEIS